MRAPRMGGAGCRAHRRADGLAFLLALLLAAVLPARAQAHAEVVRSDPPTDCGSPSPASFARAQPCPGGVLLPAPPTQVRILFSEPVSPVAGGISVLAPSGRRADRGPVRADGASLSVDLDGSEPGTYQVRWRVVAADTHPARGAFAFSVGRVTADAAAPAELGAVAPLGLALQIAGRWLHFVGFALAFGTLAVVALVPGPARSPPRERLVAVGIVLLLLAEPVALVGQTASLDPSAPLDLDLLDDAVGSTFGRLLGMRLAAPLLLWTLLGVLPDRADRRVGWLALALALPLAAVDAAAAHAASFQPPALGLLVGAVHVAAMALWLGALAALLFTRQPTPPAPNPAPLPRLVAVALATLALTGGAMALVHLAPLPAGLATPYGLTLLAKLAVVALALALAFAAARRPTTSRPRALEAAALTVALALAGALVSLPPPR